MVRQRSDDATKRGAAPGPFRARRMRAHGRGAGSGGARGVVLLEVIVALAILVLGMAAVGLQVSVSMNVARNAEVATRAVMLAESKLAELDAGVSELTPNSELEGDFGRQYPGWAWRAYVEPTETPDLNMVTLEVLYKPGVVDYEEMPNFNDMTVVHTSYTLRVTPAVVDLARDFGFTQEALQEAAEQVPVPGFDPQNIDPRILASLDAETLAEVLPVLMQILGSNGALLSSLPQTTRDQLRQEMSRSQGRGGRGPDAGEGMPALPEGMEGLPGDFSDVRGRPPGGPPGRFGEGGPPEREGRDGERQPGGVDRPRRGGRGTGGGRATDGGVEPPREDMPDRPDFRPDRGRRGDRGAEDRQPDRGAGGRQMDGAPERGGRRGQGDFGGPRPPTDRSPREGGFERGGRDRFGGSRDAEMGPGPERRGQLGDFGNRPVRPNRGGGQTASGAGRQPRRGADRGSPDFEENRLQGAGEGRGRFGSAGDRGLRDGGAPAAGEAGVGGSRTGGRRTGSGFEGSRFIRRGGEVRGQADQGAGSGRDGVRGGRSAAGGGRPPGLSESFRVPSEQDLYQRQPRQPGMRR